MDERFSLFEILFNNYLNIIFLFSLSFHSKRETVDWSFFFFHFLKHTTIYFLQVICLHNQVKWNQEPRGILWLVQFVLKKMMFFKLIHNNLKLGLFPLNISIELFRLLIYCDFIIFVFVFISHHLHLHYSWYAFQILVKMEIHKNDFKPLAIYCMWFGIKSSHDQL